MSQKVSTTFLNKNFDNCSDDSVDITFDPNDEVSYYYGNLNRDEVKDILNEASIGTFLIRDSTKDDGQNVLCVKEAAKCINNYKIIHKVTENQLKNEFYLYGKEDLVFKSIPSILEFYSTHYLNQSPLVKPVSASQCIFILLRSDFNIITCHLNNRRFVTKKF